MPRPAALIEDRQALSELCRHLEEAERFALDTEFVTEYTFVPVLCLVQVATPDRLAVVDPLAVGDLHDFWKIVAAPRGRVVAHAADAEIRFCRESLGVWPKPFFDVQIAAGLAGYGFPISYTTLVRRVLGEHVHGSETRTDWRRRPLTEKQRQYALEDVRHLLAIQEKLESELGARGRLGWAAEEFQAQVQRDEPQVVELWRRVSGVTRLNRRQLAVLRELAAWRDQEARRRDRPVRSVASDDVLVELARRQPADLKDLTMFRGMNRRNLMRVAGQMLDAVRRGMAVPDTDCPSLPARPDDSERVRVLAGVLATALAARCASDGLPPAMVATAAELAALVRGHSENNQIPPGSPLAHGWRGQLYGPMVRDLLEGRRCLRVTNPRAAMPLGIDEHQS